MDNIRRLYPPKEMESSFSYVDVPKDKKIQWLYCRDGDKKTIYGYAIFRKKPREVKKK